MPTLQFKGRNIIWNHHLTVPYHTLDEVKELDVNPKKADGNLVIEGDNLFALKALLPQYSNKIKCIYIDPPYNTGNDNGVNKGWVYNDNVNSPLIKSWFQTIVSKEDLSRHEKWLCMITPRLRLLRELLSDDGVIFVSIDDNEADHLRILMNDIFGEESFIARLIWNTGRKSIAKLIAINHEYCLVYAKNKSKQVAEEIESVELDSTTMLWRERKKGLEPIYAKYDNLKEKYGDKFDKIADGLKEFYESLPEENVSKAHEHYKCVDARGIYFPDNISQGTGDGGRFDIIHPVTKKPCKVPEGGWRFNEKTRDVLLKGKRIHFGDDESIVPCKKTYLKETEYEVPSSVFYKDARGAKKRLRVLFDGKDVFNFPKDEAVIKKFIKLCTIDNDIILDSFSGAGTTAHAVMDLNKEDRSNRKFILVQMTEATEEEPKKNICKDITRERIKRVIDKYSYDAGFKYLRVGTPIDAETMLSGKLPTYKQFAKYVYYLCTGENLENEKGINEKESFVGLHGASAIHLIYTQDIDKLTKFALNLERAQELRKAFPKKRLIVYAPACFLSEEDLELLQIDFVGIPYNLFQRKS